MPATAMDQLVSLCKRRGFIFQTDEIYGGLQGVYDFGPLGVELKNNLKAAWWRSLVYERDDIEGLDAAILTHRLSLRYSGHEDTFSDPMVDCKDCKNRFRADHLESSKCPHCGSANLTEPRPFQLMLKTNIGPIEDADHYAYLRPETAQAIFTNFRNVINATGRQPPFGIAQMGKAFRNEITPRNFVFRVREFEQMELEYFVPPGDDERWHETWINTRFDWWQEQGLDKSRLQQFEQPAAELSHYAKRTVDILYRFPHGDEELEGIANRTDYDLGSHSKNQDGLDITAKVKANSHSNTRLAYQDLDSKKWVVPYVIEPSAGVERGVLALLTEAYHEEKVGNGERVVLKLKPQLAPIKLAVIPLKRNHEQLMRRAQDLKTSLQKLGLGRVLLETSGNIGKCYRKHDEVGTPVCVTVDFETIENDDSVTMRDRDTMEQRRVPAAALADEMKALLEG